ncbi:MAG: penicillin-binding protein 2 [Bacteroidota bacterium]
MEEFGRKYLYYSIISIVFLVFTTRLYQLQLIYREEFGRKSEENSIRTIAREPVRGYIYDRNGILVVDNGPSYTVTITPSEFDSESTPFLASILEVTPEFIHERVQKGNLYSRFVPVKIKRDLDFRTLAVIEEYRYQLPGIDYQIESKRYYATPARASHLLGYTKEISDRQLAEFGGAYRQGDVIGSTGIEASYERVLRGQKGYEFITVNAQGKTIGSFEDGKRDIRSEEGFDLYLALDSHVQAVAESSLTGKRGAVVAIDPTNGGIIALASKPDYDLSIFSGVTPPEVWNEMNSDTTHPLFNRATMTKYPPGSTYKIVLAAAALEEGIIDTNWTVNCSGEFRIGNKIHKDLHVHGPVAVIEAIKVSCNVFFYQLILKTGLEHWTNYGAEFGFGHRTGIDITEETSGILPSSDYFDTLYGKGKWTEGYLVNLAIGQGELGVSPLQMASYAMVLANKGRFYQPHAVDSVWNNRAKRADRVEHAERQLKISDHTWDLLREGMFHVVNSPGGTGRAARITDITVGGKTGTAQNPHGEDHAWFVGFAPFENARIAVAVLVENAGFGGTAAAPIGRRVMETYLKADSHKSRLQEEMKTVTARADL